MSIIGAFIMPHPPVVLPEVGRGEEKKISATSAAFKEAAERLAALRPDTVVLVSPHAVAYSNYFHIAPGESFGGDMGSFGAMDVTISAENDEELARAIEAAADAAQIPAGTRGSTRKSMDHGAMVPLYFINQRYTDYKLVRVSLSGRSYIDHYKLGKCIAAASQQLGRRTVIVASADLSHKLMPDGPYGFAPEGPRFDIEMTRAMKSGDFMRFLTFDPGFCEEAGECGLRSCVIMAGALDGRSVKTDLLSYEGPLGVGYAICAIEPGEEDSERRFDVIWERRAVEAAITAKDGEDDYVRLARLSLETYLYTGKRADIPDALSPELTDDRAGVFVCIKRGGMLRGCVGTIEPATDSIAEEILRMAIQAGTQDYRFPPVTRAELPELTYTVDVLGKPEVSTRLDPKRYGVIVSCGSRRGVLLPDLEGVDTAAEQVKIALQKAGISSTEPYVTERFEVIRHG